MDTGIHPWARHKVGASACQSKAKPLQAPGGNMLLDCRHLSKWFHTQHSPGVVSGLKKKNNKTKSEKKKVKKRRKKKTPTYSLRASRHMDLHHRCRLQLLWLHKKLVTRCLVFINRINKNRYTLSRILEIWHIICHSSSRRQFLEGMMKNNERGVCCQCQEQTTISNLFSESSLCKTKGV